MIISKYKLQKIKDIIEKKYNQFTVSVLGKGVFTDAELLQMKSAGIDIDNSKSLLDLVYNHNYINNPLQSSAPKNLPDMQVQQIEGVNIPTGIYSENIRTNQNDKMKQLIDKLKTDFTTKLESTIRQDNENFALDSFSVSREDFVRDLMADSSVSKIKDKLQQLSDGTNKDWTRIALTELSNVIGLGSVDRIVTDNPTKEPSELYVYRIPVNDSITCKYCRKFYNDKDGSPKLYKLSTLLANGSNYGKTPDDWKPCVGATHPNTRTSQIIELKPGFKLKPGGEVTYIGLDLWPNYIKDKVQ